MTKSDFAVTSRSTHCFVAVVLLAVLVSANPVGNIAAQANEPMHAASFSLISQRDPLLTLRAPVRFRVGDDARWSDPGLDDSSWTLVRVDRTWRAIGFGNLSGLAWYRFEITLPAGNDSYSMEVPHIRTSYQLFIDGRLAMAAGEMPPYARMYTTVPVVVALRNSPRSAPATLHFALRVWQDPVWAAYQPGGPQSAIVVGRTNLINESFTHERLDRYWRNSDWFDLTVLELFASGAALALFLLGRFEREYLWFCTLTLGCSLHHGISLWARLHAHPVHLFESVESVFYTTYLFASLEFYRTLFAGKITLAYRIALASCGFWFVDTQLAPLPSFPARFENTGELLFLFPIYAWILCFIFTKAFQHHRDAKLLVIPVSMLVGTCFYRQLLFTIGTFGHSEVLKYSPIFKGFFYGDLQDIAEAFFLIAMLLILGQRFARTRRESDRTAAELEAARSVQRVLVPESLPSIPGMEIVTAYFPAQEVGGDFFQIIPLRDEGTLVIIGDVAGKGVPAALTVSLIVGVLRTLVDFVSGPGEILEGLNRRLHGRDAGLTTCLVMQFSKDRDVLVIANAGHLPAFADSVELMGETNLPLGMLADTNYRESVHAMRPGTHIVVMTDGVTEAMCKGELFGFDRTHKLSGEGATTIAEAARNFGQSDDITVLSIDLQATARSRAPRSLQNAELSPEFAGYERGLMQPL